MQQIAPITQVDAMVAAAAQVAGTSDFGTEEFRPALEQLALAVTREAGLPPESLASLRTRFVGTLVLRARVVEFVRRHPEILDVALPAPIFIVGLPRTGTTLLHNLLSGHPDLRAPRLWEMRAIVPSGDDLAAWEARAVAEAEAMVAFIAQRAPDLARIHPINAGWPDECSWLFRQGFATMVHSFSFHIPAFVEWMMETDMEPYYRFYRMQLQVLAWRYPGCRFVLKDPCHLWHLPVLRKVFPDATIVSLHRRVDEALPSLASLCAALQASEGATLDAHALGGYCTDLVERALFPLAGLRRAVGSRGFFDVRYPDLVAQPRETLARICAFASCAGDDAALDSAMAWLSTNRQHAAGRHVYTLEQFGLTASDIDQRFRRYHEQYLAAPAQDVSGTSPAPASAAPASSSAPSFVADVSGTSHGSPRGSDAPAPSLEERFQSALAQVQTLSVAPSNSVLLELYGLYKQATEGDVTGPAPSAFDLKGRAKHKAWSGRRGMGHDQARQAYIDLVDALVSADRARR